LRKITNESARLEPEFGIQIGRWDRHPGLDHLPFGAMWCVVSPGGSSEPDHHPEIEMAVVMSGTALYTVDGRTVAAEPGSVILLEPEEHHVIHNASPDQPLTILSLYWLPGGGDDVG
jgi:quercetin dioxygenase-like cupin family protein